MADTRIVEELISSSDSLPQPDSPFGIETTQSVVGTDAEADRSCGNGRVANDTEVGGDNSGVNLPGLDGASPPRIIASLSEDVEENDCDESKGTCEEVFLLDEVGDCEDLAEAFFNHLNSAQNADVATTESDKAGQVDDAENVPETNKARSNDGMADNMDQDMNDDILSIMCDENDIDHLDLEEEVKRDWNFECGLKRTKRKSDSPVNTHSMSRPKRCHSESFKNHSERRFLPNSVHARLGPSPKYNQDNEHNNNTCYRFLKTGSCHRPSCHFLHPPATPQDTRHIRYHHPENSDQVHLTQHVQQELHQMKKQQNILLHHMQHIEVQLKHHVANQSQQVYKELQNLYQNLKKEYEDKLAYNRDVFTSKLYSMNNDNCKNLQEMEKRLKEVESALKTKDELLSHYKYITSIQEKQMDYIISGYISNDPSQGSLGRKLASWQSMKEHYLSILERSKSSPPESQSTKLEGKQDSAQGDWHKICVAQSPRPRSDDNHPWTRISPQNGRLADFERIHPQRLYLRQPLIPANTRGLIERPVYNVPLRHVDDSVHDYQHASMKSRVP
ncbi:uncharacterized protein [Asterias amurensis]|uniref:uncharacterized protein n=1 Tax=Asterias amurensis TaxID=7602 RepID=UPI003AB8A137